MDLHVNRQQHMADEISRVNHAESADRGWMARNGNVLLETRPNQSAGYCLTFSHREKINAQLSKFKLPRKTFKKFDCRVTPIAFLPTATKTQQKTNLFNFLLLGLSLNSHFEPENNPKKAKVGFWEKYFEPYF